MKYGAPMQYFSPHFFVHLYIFNSNLAPLKGRFFFLCKSNLITLLFRFFIYLPFSLIYKQFVYYYLLPKWRRFLVIFYTIIALKCYHSFIMFGSKCSLGFIYYNSSQCYYDIILGIKFFRKLEQIFLQPSSIHEKYSSSRMQTILATDNNINHICNASIPAESIRCL